jgi:hypothetical protein
MSGLPATITTGEVIVMLLVALILKLSQIMLVLFVALRNKSTLLKTYPTFEMSQFIISTD